MFSLHGLCALEILIPGKITHFHIVLAIFLNQKIYNYPYHLYMEWLNRTITGNSYVLQLNAF